MRCRSGDAGAAAELKINLNTIFTITQGASRRLTNERR